MLSSRRSALKKEVEAERTEENNKNDLGPTMPSIQSFAHHL
jgi:hypothetical protein